MSRVLLAILVCGLLVIPVSVFLMQEPRTAMITMTMDDGSDTQYDMAYMILKEHNIPATAFIVTGWFGMKPGRLSLEEMHEMQDAGWEIGSHSVSHMKLTQMPFKEVFNETYDSKTWLEARGFRVSSFAYPMGNFNSTIKQLAGSIYDVTRTTHKGYVSYSHVPTDRCVAGMDMPADHNDTFRYIDRAIAEKNWIIFVSHAVHSDGRVVDNLQDLHTIADYIEQNVKEGKLKAVTLIDGYKEIAENQSILLGSGEMQVAPRMVRTVEYVARSLMVSTLISK
jgi:peptidoglycan/xylan/chitin deacetylase (PgdA/CDA1 family)